MIRLFSRDMWSRRASECWKIVDTTPCPTNFSIVYYGPSSVVCILGSIRTLQNPKKERVSVPDWLGDPDIQDIEYVVQSASAGVVWLIDWLFDYSQNNVDGLNIAT